ncbi:ATP-binding protein [Cocleimonas sp. KMM 6892]|uniref:ATP-binding protein n=1 Tax=unclassified Cocleimonas TaxID=2639732 RepID=UPI002DB6360F|nr:MULTISPECIES: ATP-binding protein [unclassified Cocleimonas]MEB8431202.1 ATP-binding protein [Cocleimonas sp. KMM 6892]MEC4714026.1 ATP-binding protein [Cocleimonas sp. KMM 6895]MEC4743357.1 ATP-binding protein [Cocleimonas sp. KMM 6896]
MWFWITLILIGVGASWGTAIYIKNSDDNTQQEYRSRFIDNRVESLRQILYYGGEEAAIEFLENKKLTSRRLDFFVVDGFGNDVLGRPFSVDAPDLNEFESVESIDGVTYRIFTAAPKRAKNISTVSQMYRPFRGSEGVFFLWFAIAILLSSLVCFWLAWYLTKPIKKLQSAAKEFSQGKLDTRVAKEMGGRRDEIADLGRDFDQMATQLQGLITNQKQLLSDISHELRSPLARMHVAIALARKKTGAEVDTEMQRIEYETERLNELVGLSLTLSRLDAGALYPKDDFIDIAELLEAIIADCDFEASSKNKKVVLQHSQSWTLNANVELLHRALENIIRNAIRYTKEGTEVTVAITIKDKSHIQISICDRGPGVPEDKLKRLFEPFVRLSEARDRDSGGYGLGLAIAQRSIVFHQGEIVARNRDQGGLCIDIILPVEE